MKKETSKYKMFRPRLRSRHPSHSVLRPRKKLLPLLPFKSVIRMGSLTVLNDTETEGGDRVELNSIKAIGNSSNKLKMKTCFTKAKVKTADWWKVNLGTDGDFDFVNPVTKEKVDYSNISFPLVAKRFFGSRNNGNTKIDDLDQLEDFIEANNMERYLFEKYYNYAREYRLHVTSEGCFYSCRKMLKRDTPEDQKWFRNDQHCVWIMESNELFDKPSNWDNIIEESVKALNSVGLDIGAIDLRIQSGTNSEGEARTNPSFIIIEINSAPSFGTVTEQKYIEEIPKALKRKHSLT